MDDVFGYSGFNDDIIGDKIMLLGSRSPRRREILEKMDIPYRIVEIPFDESSVKAQNPLELAGLKSSAYGEILQDREILLTADTMVFIDGKALGKPADISRAMEMLENLSGRTHVVETGVCMRSNKRKACFSVQTHITFKELSKEEICYYVNRYMPLDKAGAYGIQEWIGLTGILSVRGDYYNVMGLPAVRVWEEWVKF
jgi:septum formation protein